MNEYFGMLAHSIASWVSTGDANDLTGQLQGEALHLAFLAVVGGVSVVSSIIGVLLRRDIKRSDVEKAAMAAAIVKLDEKVDSHKERHGSEIADTRIAIAPLFTKVGLDQPNYPSR